MYNAQQLYQFLKYAAEYLEMQDVEFKSSDVFADPTKEEDLNRLIAIALAEHRDGEDTTSGFATNEHGDSGNSRGPWQIYGSTWEDELREYEIFNSYANINDALDDPGLNAIAAVIIAQYSEGERKGIDNWSTVYVDDFGEDIKQGKGVFVEAAKSYDTSFIESPEYIQDPEGEITAIPAEPTAEAKESVFNEPPLSIPQMSSKLKAAKTGGLFSNPETYVKYEGNRIIKLDGETINNQHKSLLANVDIGDLSNAEIVDLYTKNIHAYLPYDAGYKGIDMQGEGLNIVDILQSKKFNSNDKIWSVKQNKIIDGDTANKQLSRVKGAAYQMYLNKKDYTNLDVLDAVYDYIFRTDQQYYQVSDDVDIPAPRNLEFESQVPQMVSGQPQAAPTAQGSVASQWLNNLEKIMRIKPQGKPVQQQQEETNAISEFLRTGG